MVCLYVHRLAAHYADLSTTIRDQELRFTVHDSPDYHQLKVSVFNDDKKTDLIGETWVKLEQVVVPGGGQSDIWHNLNCKGRYAGEIRIELTYYDTRPKAPTELPTESTVSNTPGREQEVLNGPRQPKALKRRPLPADPVSAGSPPSRPLLPDHAHSSPQSHTPTKYQSNIVAPIPRSQHGPIEIENQAGQGRNPNDHQDIDVGPIPLDNAYEHRSPGMPLAHTPGSLPRRTEQSIQPEIYQQYAVQNLPPQAMVPPHRYPGQQAPYSAEYSGERASPYQGPHQVQQQAMDLPVLPPSDSRYARTNSQPLTNQFPPGISLHPNEIISLPQAHSMPNIPVQEEFSINDRVYPQFNLGKDDGRHESLPRRAVFEGEYAHQHSQLHAPAVDGPPPAPPVHRSNGVSPSSHRDEEERRQQLPIVPAPAPLNIRHNKTAGSPSPLSQSYTQNAKAQGSPFQSSNNAQFSSRSAPGHSPQVAYSPLGTYQSQERDTYPPITASNQRTPPILVAGYNPNDPRIKTEHKENERWAYTQPPQIQGISTASVRSSPYARSVIQDPNLADDHRRLDSTMQRMPPDQYVNTEAMYETRPYPASAPNSNPRRTSPDPRTPVRKSVSPQPEDGSRGHSPSAVPFSPDSYEEFNPNLKAASSINKPGPKYNTPEQARNALRQQQEEEKLEEGPIIGSDGRVIDPSDHLPASTWAPEPEPKPARKGPEIKFRFRQSPQGAQPMPNSSPRPPRETVIRPQLISTNVHAYSADSISPTTAARNRLQKKTRASPTHYSSSPILPTANGSPTTHSPLREHINYGHGDSPTYVRSSPGAPPPIPAKIPMDRARGDWESHALSEEMSRIDIGVGSGGGRARRSRYGL